jgi:MFS family permease
MISTINRVATILGATGIMLVGHGLQISLMPLVAQQADWGAASIGAIGSVYFLGFAFGCIVNPRVVARVGHIRSFMVMASLACTALLLAGVAVHVLVWIVCRFAFGIAMSGMYMVIESWLSSITPREIRGRVLAIYTLICLLGIAFGQTLMGLEAEPGQRLFMIAAIFTALAIIPVGLTRIEAPAPVPSVSFSPRALFRASEVALVVSALAGLATGTFWSVGPLVGQSAGMSSAEIGLLMGTGVLGGAVVQIPIGHFADRSDRRRILAITAAAGAVFALGAFFLTGERSDVDALLYVSMFAIGAAIMPLYALCVGHASDNSAMSLVEVTSSVLIMNSVGSVIGPLIAASLMQTRGSAYFFGFLGAVLIAITGWATYRVIVVESHATSAEATPVLPRTTQAVADMSHGTEN